MRFLNSRAIGQLACYRMIVKRARGFEGDNGGRWVATIPVLDRGLLLAERLSGGHVCGELNVKSVCEEMRTSELILRYEFLLVHLELSQRLKSHG